LSDRYSTPASGERLQAAVLSGIPPLDTARPADAVADGYGRTAPQALTSKWKRAIDLAVATLLLVALSPVWLLCAALIKLTSRGPVIFQQERIGAGGVPFTLYKFRTMRVGEPDAEHRDFVTSFILGTLTLDDGAAYKLPRDRRITAIGRVLRKLSVDEVPQLVNVLRGEMSIVGPRPPLAYEVEHYQPSQLERLTVRPGITGLWQVSGRNRLSFERMCVLDIEYIRNWSVGLDLLIMFRTPWVMLVDGGGAE
jgi:lipopolysaccharide/colanic/teichoic acid biosynthesis glycosyltransferase